MADFPQLHLADATAQATLKTNRGDIDLVFFADQAPKTVENFLTHAKEGYYDGVVFHRVIPDFMIQGGDPEGTGRGGESIWGKPFEDEFSDDLFNLRGALSMANAGPATNGSQFFIVQASHFPGQMKSAIADLPEEVQAAYQENGGTPWLDGKHTVFGHVVAGMDVVDQIAQAEADYTDRPVDDIVIEKVVLH
ncbi:peptidyl-prolyl cis-trans isomerase [Fructobacillus pseudoficulneus]|uniref:Peptidyl-prolyl cis-trans isomerase n=1 Tax=Fructobacillus pseudoficulneus TaxID=220714 RepID=A0A3F3H3L6_9LACO|nr:peptidylprolyl isomerase [Fructobacillus pseudoficulneus]GAP03008.1 peptidyl-prolyl cis-trans isomerase [Fructobacillus pseudoficulneus]SEH44540.1 peptidyl-prolyl cis-trans isomerase B (cyclophilin B) [Fructobacillus pseudoficulneus]